MLTIFEVNNSFIFITKLSLFDHYNIMRNKRLKTLNNSIINNKYLLNYHLYLLTRVLAHIKYYL